MQITVADRTTLLKEFCRLAKEWREDDAVLIAATSKWAAGLRIAFGFEDNLTRDIIFLGDMLRRTDATNELAELARGGLAFVYENNCRRDRVATNSLGLLDDAFVAGYAAHLVREKLGEPARYSPPQLSPEEKTKAEDLFLELLDRSADEDERLPAKAQAALGQLGHLLESGLFRRLRVNVQFLAGVLRDSGRPEDHRQIARAALHYVSLGNDVIPDQLGLIGFLDDYFVADLAVGLIDTHRPPWLSLVDATVAAWPFLNMVVFEDGGGGLPLSEFLLVNTALTCPAVRGDNPQPITHLILPRTGPLPLLLGFLASLGGLWKVRMEKGNQMPFQPGQKVLVDGKAVRTFVGCQLYEGRMLFGLEKVRKERNQKLRSIEWWPLDQLYRLVPTDTERITRGKIERQDHQPLQALDYLFLSAEPVTIPKDVPQIVVSSPVKTCKETAEAVSLFGQKLTEVIPIGHLTPGGEVCPWSSRFGSSRPAVLIIPDLDRACEYVEREGEKVLLTVVDATGHNAGRTASLARLGSLGARALVVTSQADADESLTEETDSTIWEWTKEDIDSLLSETAHSGKSDQACPVRRYEKEVVRALSAAVDVVAVDDPGCVTEAFEAVRKLEKLVEGRGEEVPPELENALDLTFNVLTRLLRCPFRLVDHPRLLADLAGKLDSITRIKAAKAFLTAQEVQAVDLAGGRLRALCELLWQDNPKADALTRVRSSSGSVTILCADTDLLEAVDDLTVCRVTTALDLIPCDPTTAYVISGWFGRETMTRLLRPPFASPLSLLLYSLERDWYQGFSCQIRRKSASRQKAVRRSQVFPVVPQWPEDRVGSPQADPVQRSKPEAESADSVEGFLLSVRKKRLTHHARPDLGEAFVEARLVLFDGGHAFLTDDYRAKVATHLLDPSTDPENADLELVPARQLRHGDVLLFLRGSDRDVIRVEADKLLPPGERERAGLWRAALKNYQKTHNLTIAGLCQQLRDHGCTVGEQAIRNWLQDEVIAPLRYDRDVQAIRDLTRDPELDRQLQICLDAIFNVRSAHLRAGQLLARRVLDYAVKKLKFSHGGPVDLGEGIVLVRVTGVDDSLVRIKATAANRLIED